MWGPFQSPRVPVFGACWSWVLLELYEEGLPVTKVPRSPQRLAAQWQQFFDAIVEKRLTHEPDPLLARHAANLSPISVPVWAASEAGHRRGFADRRGVALHRRLRGAVRVGPLTGLFMMLPSGWSDVREPLGGRIPVKESFSTDPVDVAADLRLVIQL